jgi:hypothetical protein
LIIYKFKFIEFSHFCTEEEIWSRDKRNYEASIDKTWQATVKSVEDLGLSTESKENDAFNGVIKGKMADGKSFTISVKRLGENLTEVGVRVGTFGDRERSEAVHDKILSNL